MVAVVVAFVLVVLVLVVLAVQVLVVVVGFVLVAFAVVRGLVVLEGHRFGVLQAVPEAYPASGGEPPSAAPDARTRATRPAACSRPRPRARAVGDQAAGKAPWQLTQ